MIGYTYIEDLFRALLTHSKAIEGRFYISYRYGAQEINSDQLGEIIKNEIPGKKYPLAILAPPHSQFKVSDRLGEWERFRMIMFFVKTTYQENINPKTNTSTHTVTQDWHDMKRCAVNFIRGLATFQRKQAPPSYFRIPNNEMLVVPMSTVGADRVSGIRLDFDFDLNLGCDVEDYDEYPTVLTLSLDSHPEHIL